MSAARLTALFALFGVAAASMAQSPYPMLGANTQRTNRVSVEGPTDTPHVVWKSTLEIPASYFSTTPVLDDAGNLYLAAGYANETGRGPILFSYTREGKLRWQADAGITVYRGGLSTPAIRGNTCVVGFRDASVRAMDTESGAVRWTADFAASGGAFISSPLFDPAGGVILAGKLTNGIYRLRADTGETLWHFAPGGGSGSSPAISRDGRTVYCGREAGVHALFALRVSTGAVRWTFATSHLQAGWCSPLVADNGIVFQQDDQSGEVFAIRDGGTRPEVKWRFQTERPGNAPRLMAMAGDVLYLATAGPNARLLALRAEDAAPMWTRTFPGATMLTSPLVTPSTVYVGAHDVGAVYAIDRRTGATRWAMVIDDGDFTDSLSIGPDGTLYCATGASLIALRD